MLWSLQDHGNTILPVKETASQISWSQSVHYLEVLL